MADGKSGVNPTAWNPQVFGEQGLPGIDGREVEFNNDGTWVQWRYVGDLVWINLVMIADLAGPAGPQGIQGIPGTPGADGADGVVQSIVAGTNVTVDATDPANPIVSATGGGGGAQVGIASSLASNDRYLVTGDTPDASGISSSGVVGSLAFTVVMVDSEITVDEIVTKVVSPVAASTLDIGLYNFLGAGKPGTNITFAQLSTAVAGVASAAITPVTLQPGVYFLTFNYSSGSAAIVGSTANTAGGVVVKTLLLSDPLTDIDNVAEYDTVFVTHANLPGASYVNGMDLTGFTISSANRVMSGSHRHVYLTKQ